MSYWISFFSLRDKQENKKKVLETVTEGISFRGANSWILACAILVASVGLNVNSTAVIIGAMLISPLMGPIVGAGFGLGTYNFELLKRSIKNLLIATIISVFVSFLYFYVSPYKEAQPELIARTSPTIYDVLIAFFGGIVGTIAITRVEKGNPIPGVAIATALMPPLCTAGYGLAIADWRFFLGAIYLYGINCVFICIATFVIVKYLNYPITKTIDKTEERRLRYIATTIILLMLIPSAYFAYQLIEKQRFKKEAETFIRREFENKGYTIIYRKTSYEASPKKIELAFLSRRYTALEVKQLNNKLLSDYNLKNTELVIRQDSTLSYQNSNRSDNETNTSKLLAELREKIARNNYDSKAILAETKIIFPEITNLTIANHVIDNQSEEEQFVAVLIYESSKELSTKDKQKLEQWLIQKLNVPVIELYRRIPTKQ